jgi:hypothetical protein
VKRKARNLFILRENSNIHLKYNKIIGACEKGAINEMMKSAVMI